MPAIKIDQQLIVDSSDIITALDEKFPEPPLNSKDPRERAQIRVLEDWADENLYFYAVYIRWMIPDNFQRLKTGFFGAHYPALIKALAPSIGRREIGGRLKAQGIGLKGEAVIRRELRECFETIEAWLDGRDFLVGASLSRADISVFAVIDQLCEESLTPRMAKEIDRFANMKQWRERMAEETWSLSRT
jgi:glutathione S-transferase